MHDDYVPIPAGLQDAPTLSAYLRQRLLHFLAPLLTTLDARLDARLVQTFGTALEVILAFRHRAHGLLLSELGGYLLGPHRAPAGTKRLSNLLRSSRWSSALLEQFLWRAAEAKRQQLEAAGEAALLLTVRSRRRSGFAVDS
jgi:hypothetical protein